MTTVWALRGGRLFQPAPFCLVGIVNCTPDSFFDGGCYAKSEQAVEHALALLDEGAHMLDLGAESTRPGAQALGVTMPEAAQKECSRLLPVVKALREARPDAFLGVDTCHSTTAKEALELGADVINDVSAFERDPALLEVVANYKAGYVLMHGGDQGGVPKAQQRASCGGIDDLMRFFERKLTQLVRAGVPETHIVLDPGIGFGKTSQESIAILGHLDTLQQLGRPLYVGLSMKSLFGDLLNLAVHEREEVTNLAVALLAERGVAYHRVHHVASAGRALRMTQWFGTSRP